MLYSVFDLTGKVLRSLPLFRGKDYITQKLIRPFVKNRDEEYVVTLNEDCRLICNLSDWIPWNVFVHGKYMAEANYAAFMLDKASNCSLVFDVGANIGYYTIQFSKISKGRVFAFEPMDYQHAILKRNLQLNNIYNVVTVKQIVSENIEQLRIYFADSGNTGASSIHRITDRFEDLQSTSLDIFCTQQNISEIDLVKIDVEGHELAVLKGMKGILKEQRVKHCFIEICEELLKKAGTCSSEVIQYLESFGYKGYSIKTGQVKEYHEDDGDESLVYFTIPNGA